MAATFVTKQRVEFHETDAAGIAHFSSFFVWMEQAEHEFLRSVGLRVIDNLDGRRISYPRVSAHCDYKSPIRFEDEFQIAVSITRLGRSSITYRFHFTMPNCDVATGSMTAVCCELGESPEAIPLPEHIRVALAPYVHSAS